MTEIRAAKPQDAAQLGEYMAQRFCDTFGYIYDPDDLAQFIKDKYNTEKTKYHIENKDNFFRIAFDGNEIKGYVFGGAMSLPFKDCAPNSYEMQRLYVSDDMKGKGIAKLLYDELLAHCQSIKTPELYLGVWSQNERAKAFYERLGFEYVGKYLFQVGKTFDDERIMRLKVTK